MLDEHERLAAIIKLIGAVEADCLQKVVFLLQEVGAPLRYRYRYDGGMAYSQDLEADVRVLCDLGLVRVRRAESQNTISMEATEATRRVWEGDEEVRRFGALGAELASTDQSVLEFATAFGTLRVLRYSASDAMALARARCGNPEETSEASGRLLLERLGLLGKA